MKRRSPKPWQRATRAQALPRLPCRGLPLRRSPRLAYGRRVRPGREPREDRHGRLLAHLGGPRADVGTVAVTLARLARK